MNELNLQTDINPWKLKLKVWIKYFCFNCLFPKNKKLSELCKPNTALTVYGVQKVPV